MGGRGGMGGGKPISTKGFQALSELGFKRWEKGNIDRLYIDPRNLGLQYSTYNSGMISSAKFDDEKISNSHAGAITTARYFIDVNSKKINISYQYSKRPLDSNTETILADRIYNKAKKHISGLHKYKD